ncbi:hypothetical protein N7340_11170 [Comamonas aquatica]|uniref:DUF7822 domain-containing protein n=2 Tax=Comamonas aquatica TaxID=225991 RepID=UPI002448FA6C|nr:hypothetical protein [Comamonas aquatica]MDH0372336.1 hypothetical protein [Comamonas aquatica]
MPNYALLLAHDERPTATTLWPTEPGLPGAVCEGWAEWFNHMPLLFSLLMGDALHLPERVPCSFYQEADSLSALAAPMAQVQARWAWLKHLLGAAPGNWPAALAQQWQAIDHTVTTSQRQWLLLDCATLCPHDLGTPEFAAFLQAQRDQCLLWDCSASNLPQALQALKQHPDHQLGWWSPAVVARTATIERAHSDDWPSWLAEGYEERYYAAWEEEIDAYQVMPRLHPRTGQPCRTEDEREHWPVGLVTPYGRWLLAPETGAHSAFASGGCINLSFPPQAPGQDEHCGIQDANGLWLVHPNLGHREAWALTPQLMQSRTAEGRYALHRLPDLALLHSGLTAIDLFPDDQLIRARRSDDTVMVLDASGQPLFDSPYEHVLNFNPKNGLAVAFQRQRPGDRSSPLLEGVLHRSGTLRVRPDRAGLQRLAPQGLPRWQAAGLQPRRPAPRVQHPGPVAERTGPVVSAACPHGQEKPAAGRRWQRARSRHGLVLAQGLQLHPHRGNLGRYHPGLASRPGGRHRRRSARTAPQRPGRCRRHGLDAGRGAHPVPGRCRGSNRPGHNLARGGRTAGPR